MHCLCQKIMLPCGTCNCFLACFAYCVGVVKHRGPLPVTVIGIAIDLPNLEIYMWQSQVEIEHYSVVYFHCTTAFEAP